MSKGFSGDAASATLGLFTAAAQPKRRPESGEAEAPAAKSGQAAPAAEKRKTAPKPAAEAAVPGPAPDVKGMAKIPFGFRAPEALVRRWRNYARAVGGETVDSVCTRAMEEYLSRHPLKGDEAAMYALLEKTSNR